MSVNAYDTNALNSLIKSNTSKRFDPAQFLDKIATRQLSKQDADGDGDLESSELPGLSEEAFKKLDADSDGKVSKSEIKSTLQKQLDAIKDAFETGGRAGVKSYLDSIKGTTDGELLQALAPRLHGRFGANRQATQTTTSATTSAPTGTTTNSLDLLA